MVRAVSDQEGVRQPNTKIRTVSIFDPVEVLASRSRSQCCSDRDEFMCNRRK